MTASDPVLNRRLYRISRTAMSCIFAMSLARLIMGRSAALERPLPLFGVQRLSTDLNASPLTMLKRVEHLSAVTFRISLVGRSTRSVGRESLDVKRSVRVQAFTCSG